MRARSAYNTASRISMRNRRPAGYGAQMRPPADAEIYAPEFPSELEWLNVAFLRMNTLMGRGAVLVEFWDFARVNSLRTMPYLKAWHERYADAGLRVIGIHSPGYSFGRDRDTVARAVERLEVDYPVLLDPELEVWRLYGNMGWPGRYLFDRTGKLVYHPLRRGRVPRDRAGHPGARRRDAGAARPAAARGRARRAARAADRRHRPARGPRPARAGARLVRRRGLDRGRRRRRGGDASASAAARRTRCCPAPTSSRGSTRPRATWRRSRPGLRLHGVQFTPAPPAPGESRGGA